MNFLELAQKRYSVRDYLSTAVEDEKLQYVLEAARLAPTASNRQPFRLIILKTADREDEIGRIYHRDFFVKAPIILAACGVPAEAWVRDGMNYMHIDIAVVMAHITLAATDVGLGTCWIAAFNPRIAREVLHLPPSIEPVAFTPLGYPADQPGLKERKPVDALVKFDHW